MYLAATLKDGLAKVYFRFSMSGFKQVKTPVFSIVLIAILVMSIIALHSFDLNTPQAAALPIPYVGISFCGNTTQDAKLQIDRTKNYTNLFVLHSGRNSISANQSAVEEICDYAVANGLNIIVNLGIKDYVPYERLGWFWQHDPLDGIKQRWTVRWGDKFLGIYYNDEPGGMQLDYNWSRWFIRFSQNRTRFYNYSFTDGLTEIYNKMAAHRGNGTLPQDYNLEAKFFIESAIMEDPGVEPLKSAGIPMFTSDYCLYWFDYLGGYDVLFAEIGWNASVAQQIALVKGAARLQEKEWGAMLTWKYLVPPFLDSGEEIYNQMLTAYQAGAKYIVIFNYATLFDGNSAHAMTDEHYLALERFWNDIHNKTFANLSTPEAALVLPANYGWGMRNPDDTIWGFWPPDGRTQQIGTITSRLLAKYDTTLDIVYEDPAYPVSKGDYKRVYYWNATGI